MADGESAAYVDSSALVKLVVEEAESRALRAALAGWSRLISSDLAFVEVNRVARAHSSGAAERAGQVLGAMALRPIDQEVVHRAAGLEPPSLRSLHAIHLATALVLEPPIGRFFSYDARLGMAARAAGLVVEAPA